MSYRILWQGSIDQDGHAHGELREYEPFKRTICYRFNRGGSPVTLEDRLYFVQFPHTLFRLVRGVLRVGFLKHSLNSWEDRVYGPPLGNIYDHEFRVCGCDSIKMDDAVDLFWGKCFTNDGDSKYLRDMFGSFWDWFIVFFTKDVNWHDAVVKVSLNRYGRWSQISKKRNAIKKIVKRLDNGISFEHFSSLSDVYDPIDFKKPYVNAMEKHIRVLEGEGVL